MPSSESIDLSCEPLAASLLDAEQKERLTELLDRYLSSLESGLPIHPETLVEEHPDLAEPLQVYLASLDELHCAAAGFGSGANEDASRDVDAAGDTKRLGDFVLGRELGRGGMGIVYEARQISLDRLVALKVLPFAAVLDAKQIARFKTEAQAAAQILHPNIVPVFAIGVDRGVHYYAMQFIDGQPLDVAIAELRKGRRATSASEPTALASGISLQPMRLRDSRRAPSAYINVEETRAVSSDSACSTLLNSSNENAPAYFRTVARLAVQAAEALHAAHEYGIVHRDIKPSNLLLDHEGKLWVTDFGLARCQREATFSKTGDIIGTMRYMSPEQAAGQTSLIDQRADVYSLGVTLYELLTLEPAVDGADGAGLLQSFHQQPHPRSLRSLRPQIPADLESVVLKAMSRAREDRYTTAQGFADDLRRFLDGRPTIAKPPTMTERVARWALLHKRAVAAVAAVSLLACIGLAASTFLIAREKLNSDRNYERAEQNFRDAQDAVDRFGAQFAERLAGVPGAGSVRHDMLRETLAYYQRFVEQAADDPSLQADLALTYSKIGTLADEIGSTEEALAAQEQALALFDKLVAAEPRRLDYQRRLALCRNNLAMTLRRAGRIDEAQAAYRAAIDLQNRLVRRAHDDQSLSDLAISHCNLGLLLSETGAKVKAESSFREAIRLQEQLVAAAPSDAERHRNLAVTFNNLSAVYLGSSPAQSLECYESALRHQQFAAASQPGKKVADSDLAATYNNLGSLQSQQQDYAAAAASYEHAIQIQRELLKSDPTRRAYRQSLAVSFNNHGLMQSRLAKPNAAKEAFEQSIAIQESLVTLQPDDVALRSSLGGVYNNLGIACEEQRRFEDAAAAYQSAVEQQRVAYLHAPSVTRYRIFLSKHYFNFGRVLRQLGQPDRAAQIALARRELWPTDGERLFSVAEELAIASRDLRGTSANEMDAEQVGSLAIETLEQAINAGYHLPRELIASKSFSALNHNERFLKLVRQ